ncbi:hypothetical protein FHX82_001698 [Amycolatopsis bartoniae]|uniref:UPF0311 protein GCM10017566_18300 n=1 Tax=Amycolatopsis bartoniae TaxID=941986 RepID=A0A8H9IVN4_9PSEU|nr:DUF3237 family protein [Amycolatopsis bartoniae]MBB2934678.1 hypothetical protein [Amycolatopsis bartoniae]TVT09335.1 DUF3237 family protein [Amycolatopsis bartoniae]GHF45591.1 UPF0311 protein [Amycolatopsis bartoniae]
MCVPPPRAGGSRRGGPLFPAPALEYVATVVVELGAPLDFGETPDGHHRVVPITGGTVDGPELSGAVQPGGADWQRVLPDGTTLVEARYTLELETTEPARLVAVTSTGLRTGPPDVLAALARDEEVDVATYYFRLCIRATTANATHGWLNTSLLVATAERTALQVRYDMHRMS